MPIRREMRDLYPPDWEHLSLHIRVERAQGQCECTGWCGAVPHEEGRCSAINGQSHPLTGSKVVLTVAHKDHNPANCDPANLAACCQRCHLAYDATEHKRQASHTRAVRAAGDAPPLFELEGPTDCDPRWASAAPERAVEDAVLGPGARELL